MIVVSFTNVVYDFFSQVTGALCPKEMAPDSRAGTDRGGLHPKKRQVNFGWEGNHLL